MAHWGVWYRYLELGRQKSGVGATIGRFGSRYGNYGKKIAKNDVFSVFRYPTDKKKVILETGKITHLILLERFRGNITTLFFGSIAPKQ